MCRAGEEYREYVVLVSGAHSLAKADIDISLCTAGEEEVQSVSRCQEQILAEAYPP